MGALRPQAPHRSPRQAFGGNLEGVALPVWAKRAGTGWFWRADFCGYGRKCSFREGLGIGQWVESGQERDGRRRPGAENLAGFRVRLSICLPAVRKVLSGSRYGGEALAASGLLAASHRVDRPGAAHQLPGTRHLASRGALGAAWQRIYANAFFSSPRTQKRSQCGRSGGQSAGVDAARSR